MNIRLIFKIIGKILLLEAGLMVLPLIVGLIYKENQTNLFSFIIPILILLVLGGLLNKLKPKNSHFYAKEGFIIVSLTWLVMSFFGGLPLYLSNQFPSLIDSFFEISSGFTTTGASVALNVEALSPSILFWRSFTHLIGGMGVLVFALAIMPKMKEDSIYLMKAEVPGPVFGKLVSKMEDTARILYKIYLVMTLLLIIILWIAGMPLFDSILHAFGTAGTGGFGIKATSIGYYNSALIEYIIGIGMIIFGINFNLFYRLLIGKTKEFFKSEELKWYFGFIAGAVTLITLNIYSLNPDISTSFRQAFFTVASIITTTGYSTADFNFWPLFSQLILLILMFIGGCAGSTAGGIKVSRIAIAIKSAISEVIRSKNPKRLVNIVFENKFVSNSLLKSLSNYILIYIVLFVLQLLIVSFDTSDFLTTFSAVAATFNNIGPGLNEVGPMFSFAGLSNISKLVLSFGMVAGRLEIIPMLILFSRKTWSKTT